MGKKTTSESQSHTENRLSQEVWGVIYFVSGVLILFSLISHYINSSTNILGPYLGTYLASGLVSLLGAIPSFLFPIEVCYIAILVFRGITIPLRTIMLSILFTIELCVIMAIHNLPIITLENFFPPASNILGNLITFLLHYIFGSQTFGPYFICSFAMLLTIAIMFEIPIRRILHSIWAIITKSYRLCVRFLQSMQQRLRRPEPIPDTAPQTPGRNGSSVVENLKKREDIPAVEQKEQTPAEEDLALQQLEDELAAFRARKKEPIKITTHELEPEDGEPVQTDENAVDNEPDIEDIAKIAPSLVDGTEDEFCKVPTLDAAAKPRKPSKPYEIPDSEILPDPPATANVIDRLAFEENSRTLEKTLLNFGVEGKVVNISPGPVVTRYEIELAPGVKISKVLSLHDDLSMAVGGKKIRIEAPIPGKVAVGIELPNDEMQLVHFKHILTSDAFRKTKAKLPIVIGRNISGMPYVTDIAKMPHLLIAGQTGAGKSVAINSFLCSLLMLKTPDELRLILIDPKKVEMSYYENIPHLLAPVVTESKEAVKALQWSVAEMTRRYRLLAKVYARNIDSFNQKIEEKSIKDGLIAEQDNKKLPFIVIIVDELADLMLTASRDVEGLIQRIAQLARAVGLHLIVATQRPSVDIITGPIKANLTSRIAFRTIQSVDSRTILGHVGAEKLLGRGDMLFLRSGAPDIERFHGAYLSEEDVETIVNEVRNQEFETEKLESFEDATADADSFSGDISSSDGGGDVDEKFEEAARLIVSTGLGSTSLLQRRLKLGFSRAGRLMDELQAAGIVGPSEGSKARAVLITPEVLEDLLLSRK